MRLPAALRGYGPLPIALSRRAGGEAESIDELVEPSATAST